MTHRLTYEARASEEVGGSAVAVRASFKHFKHRVDMMVDPSRFSGPEEGLRLVVNPHRRLGETHDSYDFVLEGDLETMEAMGQALVAAAKVFRRNLRKEQGGA